MVCAAGGGGSGEVGGQSNPTEESSSTDGGGADAAATDVIIVRGEEGDNDVDQLTLTPSLLLVGAFSVRFGVSDAAHSAAPQSLRLRVHCAACRHFFQSTQERKEGRKEGSE